MALLIPTWSKFRPNLKKIMVPYRLPMRSWLGIDASTIASLRICWIAKIKACFSSSHKGIWIFVDVCNSLTYLSWPMKYWTLFYAYALLSGIFCKIGKTSILALYCRSFIHNNKNNISVLANINMNGGSFFLKLIMGYEAWGSS